MKNKTLCLFALSTLLFTNAHAFELSRFGGEFMLQTGVSTNNSVFNVDGEAQLNHLGKGERHNNAFIAPLGSLYYQLDDKQRLYLGTSRDDLAVGKLAFEIGYQYTYDNGTQLDISYLPTVIADEVWSNPYLTGQPRDISKRDGNAYRVKLDNLWRSGFSFDFAYANATVANEGISHAALQRDSETYLLKGQYRTMRSANSGYIGALSYTDHNAQGKAASYDAYQAELSYFYLAANYALSLTGSYTLRDYGAENPIFAKTQQDDIYRVFLAYEYKNIPGWDNWSFVSFVGNTWSNSNIDFYHSDSMLMSLGMSYRF